MKVNKANLYGKEGNMLKDKLYKYGAAFCIASLVGLGAFVYYVPTTDIPTLTFSVDGQIKQRLRDLTPISVEKNTAYFSIECRNYNIGARSYYVTSKGTSRYDEKAMLDCPREMHYLNCPNFTVSFKDDSAVVNVLSGYKSQFSSQAVKSCATSAILNAPVIYSYRNNEDNLIQENINSWN